jgi:hypothetical protein
VVGHLDTILLPSENNDADRFRKDVAERQVTNILSLAQQSVVDKLRGSLSENKQIDQKVSLLRALSLIGLNPTVPSVITWNQLLSKPAFRDDTGVLIDKVVIHGGSIDYLQKEYEGLQHDLEETINLMSMDASLGPGIDFFSPRINELVDLRAARQEFQ